MANTCDYKSSSHQSKLADDILKPKQSFEVPYYLFDLNLPGTIK